MREGRSTIKQLAIKLRHESLDFELENFENVGERSEPETGVPKFTNVIH